MATEKQIASAIKKLGTADSLPSVPAVARELGETLNGELITAIYKGEPVAFPELKLAATKTGVEKGRKSGLRFERIAARTGLGLAEVKKLADEAGVLELYTGRGRPIGGGTGKAAGAAASGRRGASAGTGGKASGAGTSGRRGKTGAAASTGKTGGGKRGTRAGANPK